MSIKDKATALINEGYQQLNIGKPSVVCATDDDFINYIDYCFKYINNAKVLIGAMSFFSLEDMIEIARLTKDCDTAHAIIWHCHKYLSGEFTPIARSNYETYMKHQYREKTI